MSARSDLDGIVIDHTFADRRTTADYVADALRSAINAGALTDGAVLNQADLANHFGVSRVPVREALRQLQAESLIELRAHQFAIVSGLDLDRIIEVYSLRAVLEAWLLEMATPHVTPEDLAEARRINEELRSEVDHGRWLELNARFHQLLYRPSGATMTLEMLETLRARSERYARMWSKGVVIHRPEEASREHDVIVDLVEKGDASGAAEAVRQHVLHTKERVVAFGVNAGHSSSSSSAS